MEIWITYSIVGDDNILFWRLNITVDRHPSFLVLTEQEEEEEDSPVLKKCTSKDIVSHTKGMQKFEGKCTIVPLWWVYTIELVVTILLSRVIYIGNH